MIDHAAIRARIERRMEDLSLSRTGVWLKDHGIGQTSIRNFLDGTNNSVTVGTISKLAKPLKVSERWLFFGEAPQINEADLQEMVDNAVSGIQVGSSIEEIRSTVGSSLRVQLALYLADRAGSGSVDGENAPGKDDRPDRPTSGPDQGE